MAATCTLTLSLPRVCKRSGVARSGRIQGPCNRTGSKERRCIVHAQEQDVDLQVMRFTLGIPGFDDTNIPRVVGCLGLTLLAVNHALGSQPVPETQVVGETVGAALALLLLILPSLELRLKEAAGGIGRREASQSIAGSAQVFVLDKSMGNSIGKELAWATFAVLRNTNCCGVVVVKGGAVVAARGALGVQALNAQDPKSSLPQLTVSIQADAKRQSPLLRGLSAEGKYMANRAEMLSEGLGAWSVVPQGAQSAFVLPLSQPPSESDFMLMMSEFPRALSLKERKWSSSIASKIELAFSTR